VATVHNLSPLFAAGDERSRAVHAAFDDAYWGSWIRMLTDGVLAVGDRRPIEREEFAEAFDLIGFSYYAAEWIEADGTTSPYPRGARRGPLGYAPWSEGLGLTLRRLADELPGRDLLVAEHGVGTDDDDWREEVLKGSLTEVERALDDGIPVKGFFHWTGVDNYEWLHGYDVPFGLFDRDRNARASAAILPR
jgi:beta-glucosidase